MITFLHVLIAISSIFIATAAVIRPAQKLLRLSFAFVALTLISGTYLVVVEPTHLISACSTGLIYLAIVSAENIIAKRRLTGPITS